MAKRRGQLIARALVKHRGTQVRLFPATAVNLAQSRPEKAKSQQRFGSAYQFALNGLTQVRRTPRDQKKNRAAGNESYRDHSDTDIDIHPMKDLQRLGCPKTKRISIEELSHLPKRCPADYVQEEQKQGCAPEQERQPPEFHNATANHGSFSDNPYR
jgi:hypothetical protein